MSDQIGCLRPIDNLVAVQTNFGILGLANGLLPGDANDDGVVDGSDLVAAQTNFGNTLGGNGAVVNGSLPEPAGLALLGAGILFLADRRRRSFAACPIVLLERVGQPHSAAKAHTMPA